jgi:hypothetical protein
MIFRIMEWINENFTEYIFSSRKSVTGKEITIGKIIRI